MDLALAAVSLYHTETHGIVNHTRIRAPKKLNAGFPEVEVLRGPLFEEEVWKGGFGV